MTRAATEGGQAVGTAQTQPAAQPTDPLMREFEKMGNRIDGLNKKMDKMASAFSITLANSFQGFAHQNGLKNPYRSQIPIVSEKAKEPAAAPIPVVDVASVLLEEVPTPTEVTSISGATKQLAKAIWNSSRTRAAVVPGAVKRASTGIYAVLILGLFALCVWSSLTQTERLNAKLERYGALSQRQYDLVNNRVGNFVTRVNEKLDAPKSGW